MKNLFSVAGKVAVVTGGSRGIGAMIAQGFVENGVKTYITARNKTELNCMANNLNNLGVSGQGECIAIPSDLSTLKGVKEFSDILKTKEKRLNILVNNAGATWGESIDDFPEAGWDKVMNLNVKAPFFLTKELLPILRNVDSPQDPNRIINIASINAYGNPKMPNYSYSASKAAVVQMTRHLAVDLAKDHINVNGIAPGLFPSKMTQFMLGEDNEGVHDNIPCGRVGNAEDAAGTAIYLSSKASAWVTGHTILLDGGAIANAG